MAEKNYLANLISMGFEEANARKKLQETNNNLELSIDLLTNEHNQRVFIDAQNIHCLNQDYKIIKDFTAATKTICPAYYLDEPLRKKPGLPVGLMSVGNSTIIIRLPGELPALHLLLQPIHLSKRHAVYRH